jgi:cytosine deaminase
MPLAWGVLEQLSQSCMDQIRLERVALIPLSLYKNKDDALFLAQSVKASQDRVPGAMLGGFIHTSNWDPEALENLLFAAQRHELDLDLHVDEELNANALGLKVLAERVQRTGFAGRVVCGHTCALSQMPEDESLKTLDQVAKAGITLVTLPITNLFLQDAQTHRTPRIRGMTLVKEARLRGIPVLIASDNVQDPFCAMGSYDPLEAFSVGVPMGQLSPAFDEWSELLCRPEWILSKISPPPHQPFGVGAQADLICFTQANTTGFPSQTHARQIIRAGILSPT